MTRTASSVISAAGLALSGTWVNQLGSHLTLRVEGDGVLRGDYRSGMGPLAGRSHPLQGLYDAPAEGAPVLLSFVVDWTEAHCVTAWSGLCLPSKDEIHTTWLMTSETPPGEEWRATVIGHDVFRRAV